MRPVRIADLQTIVRDTAGGTVYMQSPLPLGRYPRRITERLEQWAGLAPERAFLAQRNAAGQWRHVTYGDAWTRVRNIAQSLLDRGLSQDAPLLILSGNSIEHGLLALAAMHVGVLYTPVAPAYSLQASDYRALRRIVDLMHPAMVFADDGAAYAPAVQAVVPPGVELVVASSSPAALATTAFQELEQTTATGAVDTAFDRLTPDTIAKVLFTSGSTGRPKGVINTQRMLCANQEMLRSVLLFLADEPPVLCDWSPWNHTAGGNHNFGLVLYNGGTLYIDQGKPTPALFDTTVRNLRDVACTAHFAVPRTYEMLMPYLQSDAALRATFFSRLRLLFYAAAGLGQRFWDQLRDVSIAACGEEILIMTGFGATETAPFALSTGRGGASAGVLGLPAPGLELKLVPVGSKMEGRVRGPSITPGYWRDEALTAAAFDEEGFYRLGDAMRFVDPNDRAKGVMFDGRLAEDFKLSTGTWVSVGPLRTRIIAEGAGLVQDVVVAGHDRAFVSALVFPNVARCRGLCPAGASAEVGDLLATPVVREAFRRLFTKLAAASTGGSTFVARAIVLDQPPSIDAGEITDKGSLNQQAVLRNRQPIVDELYSPCPSTRVITAAAVPS
jgi:feruloyl-CoA synthase